MADNIGGLFDSFMPHGHCYLWRPDILWLNVLSDLGIAIAYFAIPIITYYLLSKRKDTPFLSIIRMFSIFILACGITHVLSVWNVWNGDYGIHGIAKAITAIISVATAIMLIPVIPKVLEYRSPEQLEATNQALQVEVKERQQAEERFLTFLDSTPDATIIVDDDGVIEFVNKQAIRLFGYTKKQFIGMQVNSLIPYFIKQEYNQSSAESRYPNSNDLGPELGLYGKKYSGEEFPVEISIAQIKNADMPCSAVSIRDMTERLETQSHIETLQSEIAHVSRLSTMGEMASGLAHELNQPLAAISLYSDATLSTINDGSTSDPEVKVMLEKMYEQSQRAGEIIQNLRQFIQKGDTKKENEDFNDLISQSIKLIETETKKNKINVEVSLDKNIDKVYMDRIQIAQVLINLLRNSIDSINTANKSDRLIKVTTKLDNDNVLLSVEDNGSGIDSEIIEKVFKPFESTKSEGMGMGMGLSISRTIIQSHRGRIWPDISLKDGACFNFSLPMTE